MPRSRRSLFSLLVAFNLGAAPALAATPLAAPDVLRKLSLTLRGRAASPAETAAFAHDAAGDEAGFLRSYTQRLDDYMNDPGFAGAIAAYHALWWHLPLGESTALATYIVTRDRPYSEIFVRDYMYIDGPTAAAYGSVQPDTAVPLPTAFDPYQMLRLRPTERRFRSLFSNNDLLQRFPDTPTNKNRKRANYVFRTFLCENLANVALPGVQLPEAGPHGTSPECVGCHTRLDPMARFFDRWPPVDTNGLGLTYDYDKPALGAVVVKGPDGQAQSFAGAAESDLGVLLKSLPAVQQCLVQKIWEFAVGPNTRLPSAMRLKMAATLQRTDSFKATLREALLHPYLWSTEEPSPLNFADVAASLETCTPCHSGGVAPEFSTTRYPFRADPQENKAVLRRLYGAASSNPAYLRMPPGTQPSLPSESVAKLRDWIAGGALDEHLQPTLNPNDSKEILDE